MHVVTYEPFHVGCYASVNNIITEVRKYILISYLISLRCQSVYVNSNKTMFIKRFTWLAGNADRLPQLIPDQILKLKQLTVLTLAETYKVYLLITQSYWLSCFAVFV